MAAHRSWTPGQAELEQATLTIRLLSKLVGMDAHMPAGAAQFKAAAFLLLARFGALDSKTMLPAVRRIAEVRDGAGVQSGERSLVS